ncbi:MAG: RNase H family protein [Candidatus Thermoplasmatota archaeon]|nr:RNase H family protein [Candidatus Thermoplasmatota archaeon]MED6345957.1 RNase H family protein [Candidatus Thermoplasmatota archaeon]
MSDIRSVHIYVDGSCSENRNVSSETRAGWGLCVIVNDGGPGNGKGHLLTELSGEVVTNEEAGGYLGAEVGSNNTAELSAIAHALRWILSESEVDSATIRGDSNYALNIASGLWKAKANQALARRVSDLWDEVSGIVTLVGEHVPAHRGHRWNERADHLAFRAMQGDSPLPLQFWKPGQR